MAGVVTVPEGHEAWRNCNRGEVVLRTLDASGREVERRVAGGGILRLSVQARVAVQEMYVNPKNDIFTNGTLKRIDNRISEADSVDEYGEVVRSDEQGKSPLPQGYDPKKAIDDDDLREIFKVHGSPFQARVKALDEGHARRLWQMAESGDESLNIQLNQMRFLEKYIPETFPHGKSSAAVMELSR